MSKSALVQRRASDGVIRPPPRLGREVALDKLHVSEVTTSICEGANFYRFGAA
jgi:hypothetical protein